MQCPHAHPQLEDWRNNFGGVRTVREQSNFELLGAIDDVWRDLATNELVVADFKASKTAEVSLNAGWQISDKRQMEFYQWLLRRRQGLAVARRAGSFKATGDATRLRSRSGASSRSSCCNTTAITAR